MFPTSSFNLGTGVTPSQPQTLEQDTPLTLPGTAPTTTQMDFPLGGTGNGSSQKENVLANNTDATGANCEYFLQEIQI